MGLCFARYGRDIAAAKWAGKKKAHYNVAVDNAPSLHLQKANLLQELKHESKTATFMFNKAISMPTFIFGKNIFILLFIK